MSEPTPSPYAGKLLRITETFTAGAETFYAGEEYWAYDYAPAARTYELQERDGIPSVATVPEDALPDRVLIVAE